MYGLPKEQKRLGNKQRKHTNADIGTSARRNLCKDRREAETPGKADIRNPLREDTANALLRAGDSLRVKE